MTDITDVSLEISIKEGKWATSSQQNKLPGACCFANNHNVVNYERCRYGLNPMQRSPAMDALAQQQAEILAKKQRLELQSSFNLKCMLKQRTAVNILCGTDTISMHSRIMAELPSHRGKILSRRCNEMGMGTALGRDGQLYMVQYFRFNKKLLKPL